MKQLSAFMVSIAGIAARRNLLYEMTRSDFRAKYLGSYLGMLWAFVHPAVYIFILWLVFQVALKSKPMHDYPYLLWMLTGIVPWFFFSDSLGAATAAVLENGFLVKKMVFDSTLLPIVKILSCLVIHLFFIGVVFVICAAYGYPPTLYNLQVLYYLFAAMVLLLGLSLLTSSVVVFLRDVRQLVALALQFLFWVTPIFWSSQVVPPRLHTLLKLNPVYYLVEGYRASFIYKVWFWEAHGLWSLYFWGVTGTIFLAGVLVFRALRPSFADVL